MGDFPENLNLQIIKQEPSPQSPEDRSPYDIKAKLNLHVKRRLQDGHHSHSNPEDSPDFSQSAAIESNKQTTDRPKEVRQKRPYHKRTDKAKLSGAAASSTTVQQQQQSSDSSTPQRKYKQKVKQIITDSQDDNSMHAPNLNSGAEEDDGGHDNDLRSGREKEKCPDVLAMVLSMKKRALMQDPEVQKFLAEVMNVIKN